MSDELEDWHALITTPGWQRLVAFVKSQWGASAYKLKIDRAIAAEDDKDPLSSVKVISQVSSEITLIMNYPQDQIGRLEKAKDAQAQTPGRRGRL